MISRPAKDAMKVGDIFAGRYLILEEIGYGGFALVFKAQDLSSTAKTKPFVALKVMQMDLDSTPEERLKTEQSLNLEKDALAKFSFSENVVGLKNFAQIDSYFYMVLELVDGKQNFSQIFQHYFSQLSTREIIYYFSQIAQGLSEIHNAGITHRDIKPGNIMVTKDEVVKISDFGIARFLDILKYDNPVFESFQGTPKFASPEQSWDFKTSYTQSDIYSVGIMLYEFSTGVAPFEQFVIFPKTNKGDNQKHRYILNQQIREEIVRPRVFNPNIPQALENIIVKALAKDVNDRFATFKEFTDELQHILDNNNAKELPLFSEIKDKKFVSKQLQKSREFKYKLFFKMFEKKIIIPFWILIVVVFLVLVILVLAG
ncbi:serine/threonine-protein kinase [Williamsoniiplasma lucivorax]|uniref:Serine/threonine protein kinase n=1 Tax=Williamsoniiplasma lucivorax TaxID=209274 RepID=A0A2S5RFV0_9MOLU|nr:serine/threonine-protein kinase [Williamsoniiplasma lucivorax]PPE06167.1 serine/threonine protein kinase [Williamsoniiplasma lucivorax]